jgi:hypothetical protein
MKYGLFIFFILGVRIAFTFIPDGRFDPFIFADVNIRFDTFAYHLNEHVAWILLSYVLYVEVDKFRTGFKIFYLMTMVDMMDFILCYNNSWFHVGAIPVSFNTLSFLFFGTYLIFESWKDK